MKKYLWFAGLFILLTACEKGSEMNSSPVSKNPVTVKLHLVTDAPEDIRRVMDENTIKDVNLFLYGDFNYHFYFENSMSSLFFEVIPGIYQIYIVTNTHTNMGTLTKSSLLAFGVSVVSMNSYDDIPMTAQMQLIVGGSGALSQPTVQVQRCAAKISYSIKVADAVASDIKLRSVQFCNLPKKIYPFDNSRPSSIDKSDYYNEGEISASDTKNLSGIYYLFENKQGTNSSITNQRDKSRENAPTCASYIRVLAHSVPKNAMIEYIVYLGENNTTDFNVRRNTQHTLELNIKGESEIDNRVSVYEGIYYGEANCHICIGSQITFDIAPYRTTKNMNYAYTGIYAGKNCIYFAAVLQQYLQVVLK